MLNHLFRLFKLNKPIRTGLLLVFTLNASILGAKLPDLSPQEVLDKTHELTQSHIDFHEITPKLILRTLANFVEHLDPTKSYLYEEEIQKWLEPEESELVKITEDFKRKDFTAFEQIVLVMRDAINRRRAFHLNEVTDLPDEDEVSSLEFEEMEWTKTNEELHTRNVRIHVLQGKITSKLDDETKEKFFLRLEKRRAFQEDQVLSTDSTEAKNYLLTQILKATASAFDNHTAYLTPGEATQFLIDVQLRLFGIGVLMRDDLNGFTIVQILDKSPTAKANKIKPNDRIIAVDHEPVVGMEITEAVELIRGPENTDVVLTILREATDNSSETFDVTITRGEIVLEETRMDYETYPFGNGTIASIHFPSFYQDQNTSSSEDLKLAIEKISQDNNINGIIIDLRGNTGGVLPQAVRVAGLFISKGVIASIVDRSQNPQHLREVDNDIIWPGPLIVLVNKASASAAEIVAQSLQDYGRAIIVGDESTFGKGTFQVFSVNPSNPHNINPTGEYKVTLGKYYTVSGKTPQLHGVKSDVIVPGPLSKLKIGEQYSKYPLASDSIAPHFDDKLEDLPPFQRKHIYPFYSANLQKKSNNWTRHLDTLQENSKKRLDDNIAFQHFLTQLDDGGDDVALQAYLRADLQKLEALNIMKDMIVLDTP